MARKPRKEDARSKKRTKKGASGRRSAPKRRKKRERKSAGKVANAPRRVRPTSSLTALKRELNEAQARQAATAEILKIIANSPTDVNPVFEAIVTACARMFRCDRTFIQRCDGATYWAVAAAGPDGPSKIVDPTFRAIDAKANFPSRAIVSQRTLHLPDWSSIDLPEHERGIRKQLGINSALFLPLVHDGRSIGVLGLASKRTRNFDKNDIALAESFRDQALIAIENARLLNETKEALARQTATADVLKVIASSPSNLQPVFDAVAERSKALIGGHSTIVVRYIDGMIELAAFTPVSPEADTALHAAFPRPISSVAHFERIIRGELVETIDTQADSEPEKSRTLALARDYRSRLMVPLRSDGGVIGTISVTRKEPGAFADKDKELLQTFADQAVIAIQNAELFEEVQARTADLQESLQQQTATADVLKVISRSAFDLHSVLQTLVDSAAHLCDAEKAFITRQKDGAFFRAEAYGLSREFMEFVQDVPVRPERGTAAGRALLERQVIHIADVTVDAEYAWMQAQQLGEFRTILAVPMLREGNPVGVLILMRSDVRPFTAKQIELVTTFADQAVIAIENVRLFNETKEALARQTATADVLKVIASSPSNLQPVFDAIAERSKGLIGGHSTTVFRFAGDMVELVGATSVGAEADAVLRATFPMPRSRMQNIDRVLRGEVSEIVDALASTEDDASRNVARARGWRSRLVVPLKGDNNVIGFISITRKETGGFADKDVELVRTFADQAVIAIQNVELFEEVQARTRDLQESLQQQTATADVLKVISRSAFDLHTVLDTLVESAYKLCGAGLGLLYLRGEDAFECKATAGIGVEAANELFKGRPIRAGRGTAAERVILTGKVEAVTDFFADPEFDPLVRERIRNDSSSDISQLRSTLAVPMMRENEVIGVLVIARTQTGPFPQRQIELLQTFADQAVIAIENLRLFNETTRALEQQTATADILKVIASSPDDVQPVFQAIADRSKRLVNGFATVVVSIVDDTVHLSAFTPTDPAADAALKSFYPQPLSTFTFSEDIRQGKIHRVVDAEVEVADQPVALEVIRRRGWRSALWVPLLRDGKTIGVIGATRVDPGPFADHHVQLLQTFADQAVIAISNVELFQQVQQRTRELSQSLDDLRAAQDRLVQTEKLASLGQLTAGIAHEIKNPLNFVNNFSALSVELTDELKDVLKQAELAEKIQQDVDELTQLLKSNLEKVVQHGKRADSIVKNMLLHSREGSGEQRAADINTLVEESLNLAYHGARAEKAGFNITLQREFDAGAGSAELFPQEMTRALLNLISNGFYAAARRKADHGDSAFEPTLLAMTKDLGGSVEIRIRDNGAGIPPEVKEKMFNPFFTTKPAGEGTGLGLSMTHDIIVKQHGGTIDVATEPGEFTEFIVVLPRANGSQTRNRGQA